MSRKLIVTLIVVALAGISYGYTVIGNFEETNGQTGWIDWQTQAPLIPNDPNAGAQYQAQQSIGVTNPSYSLGITQSGWGQSLAIKLQDNGFVDDFMSNNILAIDFSVPAGTGGGWVEIYTVSLNADDGAGGNIWVDLDANKPAAQLGVWDGSPVQTVTVMWDYSEHFASMAANPSFVELIFAFNSGDTDQFYVDNARLMPEPTTIALLGLGGLLLRRRKH